MDNNERKYTAKEAMQSVVEYLSDKTVGATQVITIRTISETERNQFVRMFAHWLHKNRKRIFLLVDNVTNLKRLRQRIEENYRSITIVETATLEEHGVSDDMILNRINGAEADCIIVSLPQEVEEAFIGQNRLSLNTKVWLGIGCKREWQQEKSWFDKVKKFVSDKTQKNR